MSKKDSRRLNKTIVDDHVKGSTIVDDPGRASSIVDEYIRYHEKYEKVYGKNRSIVLMQVGSFHEA